MSQSVDYREHLKRQLTFLHLSCQSYDAGFSDESIRIASVIRTLVHETKGSRPLLRHLNAMDIMLASTCSDPTPGAVIYSGLGRIRLSSAGVQFFPVRDVSGLDKPLLLEKWWNQTVYIQGTVTLSRRSLVLTAADKDGGAHIDSKLTAEYEALMNTRGQGFWSIHDVRSGADSPITDAHLVFLRQIGFEVLNSPDVLALCVHR